MNIEEWLEKNRLLCDGAFGTYILDKNSHIDIPELANISNGTLVRKVHREYLEAGAKLIRTNTFAAYKDVLGIDSVKVNECIVKGYELAASEAKNFNAFVAGDIGPLASDSQEYYDNAMTLIKAGASILVFESFSELDSITEVLKKIKSESNPYIIVQFCIDQYGFTSGGRRIESLLKEASLMKEIDALGINCGIGPGHLLSILNSIKIPKNKPFAVLPNAGYPKTVRNKIIYNSNSRYFVDKIKQIYEIGIDIVGGCCGTTPEYIKMMNEELTFYGAKQVLSAAQIAQEDIVSLETVDVNRNAFYKDTINKKIIAAELAPPFDTDISNILSAAKELKTIGVDIVTFPDSPSGRTRVDSFAMASKIAYETRVRVMPHVCCRDKNAIAIMAQILGAHINNIRNFLVITGDPVPMASRGSVKGVFNFNSVGMMNIMKQMNKESFVDDEISYGGAINLGAANIDNELNKVNKKINAGAGFFFTQPVFNNNEIENLKYIKSRTETIILCGLMPLVSRRNALFIKNEIAGINVTDEIVEMFRADISKEEGEKTGIDICRRIIEGTSDFVDGYYFSVPFNRAYLVRQILKDMNIID